MSIPASIGDVERRFRPLTDQEAVNAQTFLGDAWWMLLARRPNIEADVSAGTVRTENVVRVLASMVVRIMRNPDGYDSETIDDYTYRRNALVSSGALLVTDDELADVTPGRRSRRSVRLVVYGDA